MCNCRHETSANQCPMKYLPTVKGYLWQDISHPRENLLNCCQSLRVKSIPALHCGDKKLHYFKAKHVCRNSRELPQLLTATSLTKICQIFMDPLNNVVLNCKCTITAIFYLQHSNVIKVLSKYNIVEYYEKYI